MGMIGRFLCQIGIHDEVFHRYFKGWFRPHFKCRRKGCDYFND